MAAKQMSFAEIGDIFNTVTNLEEGGVTANNQGTILKDLSAVQTKLQSLINNDPADFSGVAGIHAQNVVDQLNLEMTAVKSAGTDPFASKYINDVQRDLIDIVQGDTQLQSLATQGGHNGFAAVPDLLQKPAPFVGNADQTAFLQNFGSTTTTFVNQAEALVQNHGSAADVQALVGQIQAYDAQANQFTLAQGGVYSARFNNEFSADGVNGTASRALISGLESGNLSQVQAAGEVLNANAADVMTNMLPVGSTPVAPTSGIPAQITSFGLAGQVFNDATTKLIGGVFSGSQQSVHDDLTATQTALQGMVAQGQFSGQALKDVNHIVNLLGKDASLVATAATDPNAAQQIHHDQIAITNIVANDPTLAAAAAANGANGFMRLPPTLHQLNVAAAGDANGNTNCPTGAAMPTAAIAGPTATTVATASPAASAPPAAMSAATPLVDHSAAHTDLLAHIFHADAGHHFG